MTVSQLTGYSYSYVAKVVNGKGQQKRVNKTITDALTQVQNARKEVERLVKKRPKERSLVSRSAILNAPNMTTLAECSDTSAHVVENQI